MPRFAILMTALATVAAAGTAGAGELLPFEAHYNFNYSGFNAGTVTTLLRRDDRGQWIAERHARPQGFARLLTDPAHERSELQVDNDSVRPLRYTGSNGDAKRDVNISFDWQRPRATGSIGGQPVDEALKSGMQDDLSMLIAFTHELDSGRELSTVTTIGDSGIRNYQLSRTGAEELHTPLGDIDTVIYRAQRSGSPRQTIYWCAPSLGYLPLKAEQRRGDDVQWTMSIASLQR